MPYTPTIHHRRSIRLKEYDYSQAGLYFVTICVQNRECLFGKIVDDEMILNDAGKIVHDEWIKSVEIRSNIILHEFTIMPNHFHGIIEITNAATLRDVGALRAMPLRETTSLPVIRPYSRTDVKNEYMSSISPKCGELATIVRAFKSAVTKHVRALCATPLQPTPQKKLWQRNYWENIIRNEQSYQYIANYITNNPAKWENDKFYTK